MAANELVEVVDQPSDGPDLSSARDPWLSSRQMEIMNLAAEGASNRKLGQMLGISKGAVKQHMSRVFKTLGVQNRAEAVAYLRRAL